MMTLTVGRTHKCHMLEVSSGISKAANPGTASWRKGFSYRAASIILINPITQLPRIAKKWDKSHIELREYHVVLSYLVELESDNLAFNRKYGIEETTRTSIS